MKNYNFKKRNEIETNDNGTRECGKYYIYHVKNTTSYTANCCHYKNSFYNGFRVKIHQSLLKI